MSDFDWDVEAPKAREEWIAESHGSPPPEEARREGWNACMNWVLRMIFLQILNTAPDSEA